MEPWIQSFAGSAALVIEFFGIVIVALGSLDAFVRIVAGTMRRTWGHGAGKEIWRRYGMWLVLGLEFELAADIVRTAISPSWIEIGQLGAIAVIRTFLNYFLERDLENARTGEAQTS